MPLDYQGAYLANNNSTANSTIPSATASSTPARCLYVAGLMISTSATITAPSGWSTLVNDLAGNSNRRGGIFYRWVNGDADKYPFEPSFSAPVLAAANLGSFTGVDPDNPFADAQSAGSNGSKTITGPSVNAIKDSSIALWFWGIIYSTGDASQRPVMAPQSVTPFGSPSQGSQNTSNSSAGGVNMNAGFEIVNAGDTGTRTATVPTQNANRGTACMLTPAPGRKIQTAQFIPFFGRGR